MGGDHGPDPLTQLLVSIVLIITALTTALLGAWLLLG